MIKRIARLCAIAWLLPLVEMPLIAQDQLHVATSAFAPRNSHKYINAMIHVRVTPETLYFSMDGQDGLVTAPFRYERLVRDELLTYRDFFLVQRSLVVKGVRSSVNAGTADLTLVSNQPLIGETMSLMWPELRNTIRSRGMNLALPLTLPDRQYQADQWIETHPLQPGDYLVAGKLTSGSRLEFGEPPVTTLDAPKDALAVHWIVPVDDDFEFDEYILNQAPEYWFYQLLATNCIRRLGLINSQIRLEYSYAGREENEKLGKVFARLAEEQSDAVSKTLLYGRSYQFGNFHALVPYLESLSKSSVLTPENYAYEIEGQGMATIWRQPWGRQQYRFHATDFLRDRHLMPDQVIDEAFRSALETNDPEFKSAVLSLIPYFPLWATNEQILQLIESVDPAWTSQLDQGSEHLNRRTFAAIASSRLRSLISTPYGLPSFDWREYSSFSQAGASEEELLERWKTLLSDLDVSFAKGTHPFNKAFSEFLAMDIFEARQRFGELEMRVVQVLSDPVPLDYRELYSLSANGGRTSIRLDRVAVQNPVISKLESDEEATEAERLTLLTPPPAHNLSTMASMHPMEAGKWYVVLGTRVTEEEHIRLNLFDQRASAWLDANALPGEFSVTALFPTNREGIPGLALEQELRGLEYKLAQAAVLIDPQDIDSVLHGTRLLTRIRPVLGYPAPGLEVIGDLLRQQAAHSCDYGRFRLIMTATLYGHPVGMSEFLDLVEPLTGYVRSDRRIEGEQPALVFNTGELSMWAAPISRMQLLPPHTRTASEHERLRKIQSSGDLPDFLLSVSGRSALDSRSMKPFDQAGN